MLMADAVVSQACTNRSEIEIMNMLAVGAFGILGALLRYFTGVWVGGWWASPFPLDTLLINFVGCLVLSWFSAWVASRPNFPSWIRLGIGTGLVGSFTTFSALNAETVSLIENQLAGYAALYVLLSLLGGFVFAWTGFALFNAGQRSKTRGVRES